jgi:hypothetical protein
MKTRFTLGLAVLTLNTRVLLKPPPIIPWLLQTTTAARNCLSFLHIGPRLLPSCANPVDTQVIFQYVSKYGSLYKHIGISCWLLWNYDYSYDTSWRRRATLQMFSIEWPIDKESILLKHIVYSGWIALTSGTVSAVCKPHCCAVGERVLVQLLSLTSLVAKNLALNSFHLFICLNRNTEPFNVI